MKAVQNQIATRAIRMLDAVGARYKVILPDDTEFGDLIVMPPKLRTRKDRGALHEELRTEEKLTNMKVGDVVEFPLTEAAIADGLSREGLQGIIASACTKYLGKGNFSTHMEGSVIEVLRIE